MLLGPVRRCILVLQVASALLLAGCGNYASDIAAVQRAQVLPGLTNEDLVLDLGGARASVKWSAEPAEGDDSGDIIAVTAVIKRVGQLGMRNTIELHYIHNRQTKAVALEEVLLNGKRQEILSGALSLFNLNLLKLRLQ
jgi:hypothetical protein